MQNKELATDKLSAYPGSINKLVLYIYLISQLTV